MTSFRSIVLLTVCALLLTACGDDSSSTNSTQKKPATTKTSGEKANILLKHMSGKDETVIDKMNDSMEQYNQTAMNEMLPEDVRKQVEGYNASVSKSLAGYQTYLDQFKALASKLNTDEVKKLLSQYTSQLTDTQAKAGELKAVDSKSKFDSLKSQLDAMLAKLADLKKQSGEFDSSKAISDGVKGLLGN